MDPPPLPHSHSSSSSYTSLPILAISVLGILTTAILLLSYYLFIINCCLHCRRGGGGGTAHLHLPFRLGARLLHSEPARVAPGQHSPHEAGGLDPAAIRSIPALRFARGTASSNDKLCPAECAVCLADFEERELLRVLPGCGHSFHIDCIDTWLQSSAICPLCRLDVSRAPVHLSFVFSDSERDSGAVVTDIGAAATEAHTPPIRTTMPKVESKQKKLWQVASKGDECIDIGREKDERFAVQPPIRRSFSMDSSNDRSLFLSVQELILQQNRPEVLLDIRRGGEGSSSGGGGSGNASGRIRRSFFSFGRSSRITTAVLPVVQSELC